MVSDVEAMLNQFLEGLRGCSLEASDELVFLVIEVGRLKKTNRNHTITSGDKG